MILFFFLTYSTSAFLDNSWVSDVPFYWLSDIQLFVNTIPSATLDLCAETLTGHPPVVTVASAGLDSCDFLGRGLSKESNVA